MTSRDQILDDSSSLLKDDPQVAEAIVSPPPLGSRATAKLRALGRLAGTLTPAHNAMPSDPAGHLQHAIPAILFGKSNCGVSLSQLAERTNPHDPLVGTQFALSRMYAAIHDIGEYRINAPEFAGWSPDQTKALGDAAPAGLRGWVHLGYRIDALALLNAVDELAQIERAVGPSDPRRSVVMACLSLVTTTIHRLRRLLVAAGKEQLELRRINNQPGQFSIDFVPWPDSSEPDANSEDASEQETVTLPAPTELERLLARAEEILDARLIEGGSEAEVRVDTMDRARTSFPDLYRWATRRHGVGDVHLAVIALVQRRFDARATSRPPHHPEAPEGSSDKQEQPWLLLQPLTDDQLAGEVRRAAEPEAPRTITVPVVEHHPSEPRMITVPILEDRPSEPAKI